ncbi:MAG: hypothetical protein OHK0029_16660 [Armatimonadaceae bacterium]
MVLDNKDRKNPVGPWLCAVALSERFAFNLILIIGFFTEKLTVNCTGLGKNFGLPARRDNSNHIMENQATHSA